MKTKTQETETVGRTYTQTRWGVHSRLVGGDGKWYGTNHHKTKEEAEEYLRKCGEPLNVGGITVAFQGGKDRIEYRIVRFEMQCTVEHVEHKLI